MNSQQYEELCRFFLADKLGFPAEKVRSVRVKSPTHPDLLKYEHQIDLYWEDEHELARYLNIANAKWRSKDKVDQGEVLLLQQVEEEISAHKAMVITNTDFTQGARAVAENKGIALHIVRPNFDHAVLHVTDRNVIQTQIQEMSSETTESPYLSQIVYRAFDPQSPRGGRRVVSKLPESTVQQDTVQRVVSEGGKASGGGTVQRAVTRDIGGRTRGPTSRVDDT